MAVLIHFEKLPVREVEKRVKAQVKATAEKEGRPKPSIIELASHIYPDAQHGNTLDFIHERFLNIVRDLESMPEVDAQFEKTSKDFQHFWYKVKLVFDKSAEAEVLKALKDNDITLVDEID